jgi:hypothetical protein
MWLLSKVQELSLLILRRAGNINQLILKADTYAAALEETQGIIAEFVNPKYKDDSRTAFKSSTRLECMMQDFPHGLPASASVGFTVINQVWVLRLRPSGSVIAPLSE